RYRTGDVTRFVDGPCPCGRTHRRIARLAGRVDDMLVIRGVNVFPSAIEAVVLDDPALAGHYALVVDRRAVLANLEVHCELASASGRRPSSSASFASSGPLNRSSNSSRTAAMWSEEASSSFRRPASVSAAYVTRASVSHERFSTQPARSSPSRSRVTPDGVRI